jgi:hypothetical protein
MIHLLTLLICLLGFIALALAMDRQQDEFFGRALPQRTTRRLRLLGSALLLLALGVITAAQGWGMGLVSYSGHTSLAAGVVYGVLILWGRR